MKEKVRPPKGSLGQRFKVLAISQSSRALDYRELPSLPLSAHKRRADTYK